MSLVTEITPTAAAKDYWRDIWRYRELLFFLARRDVSVRYKQTAIGISWAVVRPLVTMLIFTLVFGKIAKLPSEGVPYALLVFSGLLPWFLFASVLGDSSNSLVSNANLLSKVYFPRLLVLISATTVAMVDFLIGLVLFVAVMALFGYPPSARVLSLPIFFALAVAVATGVGLWFAALNVKYRDFQFVVPFLLQLGLYVSPVGFSIQMIPDSWLQIYRLNPMVGVIEGFRWALLGGDFRLDPSSLLINILTAVIFCASGLWFFRRVERSFADVI